MQVCCWSVSPNDFIDAAYVHCDNPDIDNRTPKSFFLFGRRASSSAMVDCIQEKSSERLSVRKVDGALSWVRTSLGNADSSAPSGRTTKPRCMIFASFTLKRDMLKTLLMDLIAFFTTKPIDNLEKILRAVLHAVHYQKMVRTFSTSSVERKTNVWGRAVTMTFYKNANTDKCLSAMRETIDCVGFLPLQTQAYKILFWKTVSAVQLTDKEKHSA